MPLSIVNDVVKIGDSIVQPYLDTTAGFFEDAQNKKHKQDLIMNHCKEKIPQIVALEDEKYQVMHPNLKNILLTTYETFTHISEFYVALQEEVLDKEISKKAVYENATMDKIKLKKGDAERKVNESSVFYSTMAKHMSTLLDDNNLLQEGKVKVERLEKTPIGELYFLLLKTLAEAEKGKMEVKAQTQKSWTAWFGNLLNFDYDLLIKQLVKSLIATQIMVDNLPPKMAWMNPKSCNVGNSVERTTDDYLNTQADLLVQNLLKTIDDDNARAFVKVHIQPITDALDNVQLEKESKSKSKSVSAESILTKKQVSSNVAKFKEEIGAKLSPQLAAIEVQASPEPLEQKAQSVLSALTATAESNTKASSASASFIPCKENQKPKEEPSKKEEYSKKVERSEESKDSKKCGKIRL